jgi:hypothetical protein
MSTAQICDPEGLVVTLNAKGGYSPDVMDDICARAVSLYREVLHCRLAAYAEGSADGEDVAPQTLLEMLAQRDEGPGDE